ncbi:hypothetical protein FS837_001340 [Tulasnella sp. UAMH 9824]|nr:hypothetical protein FS837_001340 [Tulasnella sp. UAMH 9824]
MNDPGLNENAGLDLNNPAEACLAIQKPLNTQKGQPMQERLKQTQTLVQVTKAMLEFHGARLSPEARLESYLLVKKYEELLACVGLWTDVKYRLGTQLHKELSDMERGLYRNHRAWSVRISQKLAREKEMQAAGLPVNEQSTGTAPPAETSGDPDANLLPRVDALDSDLRNNLNKLGTVSQQKFELNQESKVWRLLRHKNILPLLGVCEMGDFVGLISPYISSTSWKYNITQFTIAQNISFLRQIADALEFMHGLEIIHGDVKADNILIDSTPSALLCDFGLSLQRKSDASRASQKGSGSGIHKDPNLIMKGKPLPKNRSSDVWAFSMTMVHTIAITVHSISG